MDIKYKTLSTRSAKVIKHFMDINQSAFRLDEVASLFHTSSHDAVKKLMRDMVKRGLLLRLRDGLYWIIPYELDAKDYFPNPHLVVKYLAGEANYYIGYYSAMEVHSLITQPSYLESIVVDKQIKPSHLKIKGRSFQFIFHNQAHFFGYKPLWVDSFNKVNCSDLEKTFIDSLYKPDYGGGISEIAKALFKSREKIDYPKLLKYCKTFKAQSVIKRLGFLLELLEIKSPIIKSLERLKSKSYILLEPSYEKKGKLISRWSLQQNLTDSDITSSIFS